MSQRIVIVGGGGKVALLLAKRLSTRYAVESIIRSSAKSDDVKQAGAKPVVLSVEEDDAATFAKAFEGSRAVVWSAGAGGKGGPERTNAVDRDGAIKVFDAIESLDEPSRPRLLVVSALGTRDRSKPAPSHWTEEDKERMEKSYKALAAYYPAKLAADQNLAARKGIRWTILRPGGLSEDAGTGRVALGQTHTTRTVPREDVAAVLAALIERDASTGLAFDLIGGETAIDDALDASIKQGGSELP